ncbi:MAG TPA: hypothetical protein VK541_17045 [Pedobacter sp.]|uniref:hypothetical protein n=1 Tax=Pedobacter sp. TaxID=1411316 RepID=UPI002C24A530|nr:hypothetical protein [Pedobacter sp.]HMI04198.1 hypothetical protein [Pedobacter sp.]
MKKILLTLSTLATLTLFASKTQAQGCVAIRSTGGICSMTEHPEGELGTAGGWVLNVNERYFMSNKHFKGDVYQKERLELGNEVINHQFATDISLIRIFDSRWSAMIDVPVISNMRSSKYEHGGNAKARGKMRSFGLGDIRVAAYRWLFDPVKNPKANLQVGLGIKFATGDYDYMDYWTQQGAGNTRELRTVDQSIQLGDGGTGLTLELNGFTNVGKNLGLYANAFYLANPRQNNGVRTYREVVSATIANEAISSVPDQFMARVGANYAISKWVLSGGARVEGIPIHDVIGGSGDFRRPGYVISVEPSITYQLSKINFYASVPVAVYRKRTQSVTDRARQTGATFVNGDAAFADYSVNLGISFRL